jgi:dihydroflavonol-4-reductase
MSIECKNVIHGDGKSFRPALRAIYIWFVNTRTMERTCTNEQPFFEKKDKNVLLTGASGLLGSHITRELLRRQYTVTAFVERGCRAETIAQLSGVKIVFGDILNKEDLQQAARYSSYIIHAAASTAVIPARSQRISEINIEGTQNAIAVACENKVKRFIYVGTATSFGYGSIKNPGSEERQFCSGKFGLDYIDSKFEAHQRVLRAVMNDDLPAVIVCPTFMLGKYDTRPSSGAMVASVYNGRIPGYSRGGKNYVYVGDVATAIVNALHMGRIGESYILGNTNLDYENAFKLIAEVLNVKAPVLPLPGAAVLVYGGICSLLNSVLKSPMPVNFALARIANEGCYYDAAKARNELQMPQTPIEEAIRECFEWLRDEKLLQTTK